jgi:hypothetical protein
MEERKHFVMENENDQSDYEIAYEGDNDDDDNHEKIFYANSRFLVFKGKRNIRRTFDIAASSNMINRLDLFEKDFTVNETGARTVIVGGGKLPILD